MNAPLKDSGVEWLGRIPAHWEIRRLALCFREVARPGSEDLPVLSISIHDGISDDELDADERKRKVTHIEDRSKYKRVLPGDLAYNMMRAWQGGLGAVSVEGQVSPAYVVAEPKVPLNTRYVELLLRTPMAIEEMRRFSRGIADFRSRLYWEHFRDLKVCLPPVGEQDAILRAVTKTADRIDVLIAKKVRFIQLLREKRQALIAHAVTKGLDGSVEMKDSGVDWLGLVPQGWRVSKLAFVASELGGKTPTTSVEAYWGGNVPWVTPKDMKRSVVSDSIDRISDEAITCFGMSTIDPGAVLVVVRGMILAHSFPVAELAVPATINQDMKALVPIGGMNSRYLRYLLEGYREYVVSMAVAEAAHGTRVLRKEVWRLLPALLPPKDEQARIVAYLDRIGARIDTLIDETERSIDLLRKRRTSFITSAVTGKIDLREAA